MDDCDCCRATRRQLLGHGLGLTGALLVGADDALANTKPDRMPPQIGDRFQAVAGGPLSNQLIRPELLEVGAPPLEAFAFEPVYGTVRRGSRLHRLLVIKLDPAEMDQKTESGTADGVLIYSAVCTHKGCTVNGWKPEERRFRCPCHLSEFAPLEAGRPVDGPATRSLAMVPVGLDGEGFVSALDTFTHKPGFQR